MANALKKRVRIAQHVAVFRDRLMRLAELQVNFEDEDRGLEIDALLWALEALGVEAF
jgi:hypothetical protein